ncbi:MAG: hypothetical protein U1E65_20810 [Myxococcota bacterium]
MTSGVESTTITTFNRTLRLFASDGQLTAGEMARLGDRFRGLSSADQQTILGSLAGKSPALIDALSRGSKVPISVDGARLGEIEGDLKSRGSTLLSTPDRIQTKEDARAVLTALQGDGPKDGIQMQSMIRSLELLSPETKPNDMATHVRRRRFPDDPVMMPLGRDAAPLSPEAAELLRGIGPGTEEMRLPNGKIADVGHALVSYDALSNGRPVRAFMYTFFGDAVQGFGPGDAEGDKLGYTMHRIQGRRPSAPMSETFGTAIRER